MENRLQNCLVDLTAGNDKQAEAAIIELAALASESPEIVFDALQEIVQVADVDKRWWGVRALAAIPDGRVPPALTRALHDPDQNVRQCAALGLRLRPDPLALDDLILTLGDSDHLCADLAGDALVELGEAAVPALLETLANGSPRARLGAVRALAEIGDPRAIPALFAVLDEDSALIEYWASQGLEQMGVEMIFYNPGS